MKVLIVAIAAIVAAQQTQTQTQTVTTGTRTVWVTPDQVASTLAQNPGSQIAQGYQGQAGLSQAAGQGITQGASTFGGGSGAVQSFQMPAQASSVQMSEQASSFPTALSLPTTVSSVLSGRSVTGGQSTLPGTVVTGGQSISLGTTGATQFGGLTQFPVTSAGLTALPLTSAGIASQLPLTSAGIIQLPLTNAGINQLPLTSAGIVGQLPVTQIPTQLGAGVSAGVSAGVTRSLPFTSTAPAVMQFGSGATTSLPFASLAPAVQYTGQTARGLGGFTFGAPIYSTTSFQTGNSFQPAVSFSATPVGGVTAGFASPYGFYSGSPSTAAFPLGYLPAY